MPYALLSRLRTYKKGNAAMPAFHSPANRASCTVDCPQLCTFRKMSPQLPRVRKCYFGLGIIGLGKATHVGQLDISD